MRTEYLYKGYCITYSGSGNYKIEGFTTLFPSMPIAKEFIDAIEEESENSYYDESAYLQ